MQKWEYLFVDANMYPFGNKLISLFKNLLYCFQQRHRDIRIA